MTIHTYARTLLPALLMLSSTSNAQEPEKSTQLEEITVNTKSEQSKSNAYYQRDSGASTRTDTPAQETSQAVKIISRQVLDDVRATRVADTYDLVSGVSRQNNFGGLWDNFAIRGFAGHENTGPAILRNGFSGNRGYNPPRDTANTERVEFLKGPAAALYGNSEPGGTLNVVTKKPQFKSSNVAEIYVGSYDSYRSSIDSTGALTNNLAYRMIVAAEDNGGFRDYVDSERLLIAPSFTLLLGPSTTLNYELEYLKHRLPMDRGIAIRDSNGNRLHNIKRSRFLGEPNAGDFTMEAYTHQLTLDHEFSNQWRGKVGLVYKDNSTKGGALETRPALSFISPSGNVGRQWRLRDYQSDDLSIQADLNGKFKTGNIGHDFMIGMEAYRFNNDQFMLSRREGAIWNTNVYAPVYGLNQPASSLFGVGTNFYEKQTDVALFVQDQLSLTDKWKLMGGLRFESYRQDLDNKINNSTSKQDHFVTSPRAGLTYIVNPEISLYTSWSRSFRPNSGVAGGSSFGVDSAGNGFDPERGRAFEIGMKYQSIDQRLGGGISVYDITKQNVLTTNPLSPDFSIAAGEVRSRGLELDLSGQITDHLRAIASYAYIDAYLGKDVPTSANSFIASGSRLSNIPKHSANALLMHEQTLANGGKLGLGGGFTYVGKRADSTEDVFELPSYVTARLTTYWQIDPKLRLSFDVTNVFDREYYDSSYNSTWVLPGAPRMLTLGLQAKF
ncbi:TonB-dependent siderophore receptor [Methylobacillus gramineus]|uniref:TonB-dependent siderophore receptor n=1 Tax=Methylobacillus gramineus TaxID=755169 RepID=UPI001CFF7C69|nr:TonB-dependent siderophore receptor [Methylobacillus gramineus]MCB5186060.1 TonB-dependent siderophore receptor [Methylobacillus gramineus]